MQLSLGFSGHFSLFSCLMFFTFACSQSHITFSHTEQIEILPKQLEKTAVEAVKNRQSGGDIENLRDNAYVEALENLRLLSESDPDAAYVINSLVEHPDQAYEMFEGCYSYWTDLEPSSASSPEDWEVESARRHYQNLPDRVQYTRAYQIEPEAHLIVMSCWFGPYWEAVAVYRYDETESTPQVEPLILPTFDSESGQVVSSESNIFHGLLSYDEENQRLTLAHKYSGTGECGFEATYVLANDDFELSEFSEQSECDGTRPPGDFPLLYP